jgi:hypothetical protein
LRLQREIDHHDPVLLDQPNQHNDPDKRIDAQFYPEEHQREQRTESRERQRR